MMDEESLFSIEQVFRSPFPFLSKSMHFVDHPFPAVFFGFTQKQFKWPTREVTVRRIPRRDREGKDRLYLYLLRRLPLRLQARGYRISFPGIAPDYCRAPMDRRNGRITYLFLDDRTNLSRILACPLYKYIPYSGHRRGFAGQTAYSRSSIYLSNEDTPYAISGQR